MWHIIFAIVLVGLPSTAGGFLVARGQTIRDVTAGVTVLVYAAAVGMVIEPGAQADFQLADGAQVIDIQVQGQDLLLQLDRGTSSTTLRYVGHSGNDGGRIMNVLGVGLLTFEVPLN